MLQPTETGTLTTGGQQRTYIKKTQTIQYNSTKKKTQIALGYQLNILKIVSNPGSLLNVDLLKGQVGA